MLPIAGNIQSARKNCLSVNYPFRKDEDEEDDSPLPPSEYDEKFAGPESDKKPPSRRELLREEFRKKATQLVIKQARERYEVIRRQEEERAPLRKRPDYYMAKDTGSEPQYNLYKTDDMMTFWSFGARSNSSRKRNTNFTKPISEQLDQQFG
ncbi:uncharacterized protein LOC119769865 [Culex quinquefasciatus]|uniref:uncharacterized protein LOC119769865 n=1 Tax=Culex quinquefasciatus TaxID=7176 RepID=UPI0018E39E2F|nr:uncharacterized protein LOC119769865 [Culex quinquefasciatus]XP_039448575.1 uncharacterized protein LOC120427733 [Culex pipiens pallens]